MRTIDVAAVAKLREIMDRRGVDYHTGRNISLMVRRVTETMVAWLEENPEASVEEMVAKAMELNKIRG